MSNLNHFLVGTLIYLDDNRNPLYIILLNIRVKNILAVKNKAVSELLSKI